MTTRSAFLFGCTVLLPLLTGCPEPSMVSRTVSVSFVQQKKIAISTNDVVVQEALKRIDEVLVSNGFVRDRNPDNAGVPGFVAGYYKLSAEGLRRLDESPGIYLKANELDIVFAAGRNPNRQVSSSMKQTVDLLRKDLSNHFGSERVKVED